MTEAEEAEDVELPADTVRSRWRVTVPVTSTTTGGVLGDSAEEEDVFDFSFRRALNAWNQLTSGNGDDWSRVGISHRLRLQLNGFGRTDIGPQSAAEVRRCGVEGLRGRVGDGDDVYG